MKIKRCDIGDVKDLQKICRQTFAETFAPFNTPENIEKYLDSAYNQEQLTKEILNPNTVVYIAYDGDQPVGHLKLNRKDAQTEKGYDDSLEVHRIYVAQSYQRHGLGAHFMMMAYEQAMEWEVSYMWLGVWEHNEKALKFYQAMGFKPYRTHVFTLGDKKQTDYILRREVVG